MKTIIPFYLSLGISLSSYAQLDQISTIEGRLPAIFTHTIFFGKIIAAINTEQ